MTDITGPAIPPATDSGYPEYRGILADYDGGSLPITEAEIILIVPVELEVEP